eukprot:CAMPEP_0206528776 /NCGR_PEP_ID=MMETSP0325_2-20121206/2187_1 /ASSEMBLY_ACC=CAM_ASM_000347 /TAXON_ID=2866 /ORGANISM="Crypthecodinium cohnii, Strain Seligo" /LENGTH=144 /DNA_ID=CAMNT_0054024525 /DNA_START=16 /DNA_END=446 /DNA_ORIENTATION=-
MFCQCACDDAARSPPEMVDNTPCLDDADADQPHDDADPQDAAFAPEAPTSFKDSIPQPPPKITTYSAYLKKAGKLDTRIGLDIAHKGKRFLKIKAIKEGLVAEWNKVCAENSVIREGDLIVAVNGVAGNSEELLTALATGDALV